MRRPRAFAAHVKPVQAEAPVRGRTGCQVAHDCARTDGQVGLCARHAKLRADFALVAEIAGIGIGHRSLLQTHCRHVRFWGVIQTCRLTTRMSASCQSLTLVRHRRRDYSTKCRFADINASRPRNGLQAIHRPGALWQNQTRLEVRYWQRRPLSLHSLFNDKAQYQERYWPNSYPNSQALCMSFLKDRS